MQAPSGWLHERQHSEDNGCQSKDNEEDLFSLKQSSGQIQQMNKVCGYSDAASKHRQAINKHALVSKPHA